MKRTIWGLLVCATLASLGCSSGSSTGTTSGTSTTGGSTTGVATSSGTTTGGTTTGGQCLGVGYYCYGNGTPVSACCPGLICNSTDTCATPTGTSTGGTSGGGTTGGSTTGTSSSGTTSGTTGTVMCPLAAASQCQTPGTAHPGSVVRGVAQLATGFTPSAGTKGDLVMFLTHVYEGSGAEGGVFHAEDHISNVDLSQGPIPFQIDMCHNDIAMYSEDDCAFNLIVILDTNGNNSGTSNFVPDVGEATSRQVINVSCFGDSQCVSATLGCADGVSCVAFTDPTDACRCGSQTCNSDLKLCQ